MRIRSNPSRIPGSKPLTSGHSIAITTLSLCLITVVSIRFYGQWCICNPSHWNQPVVASYTWSPFLSLDLADVNYMIFEHSRFLHKANNYRNCLSWLQFTNFHIINQWVFIAFYCRIYPNYELWKEKHVAHDNWLVSMW